MPSSQWITLLVYALPGLFAVVVGTFLLATKARPGPVRKLGLIGMAVLLLATLGGLALSVVQTLWIMDAQTSQARAGDGMIGIFNALRVALNVLSAGGLLTLVVALCRASRGGDTAHVP